MRGPRKVIAREQYGAATQSTICHSSEPWLCHWAVVWLQAIHLTSLRLGLSVSLRPLQYFQYFLSPSQLCLSNTCLIVNQAVAWTALPPGGSTPHLQRRTCSSLCLHYTMCRTPLLGTCLLSCQCPCQALSSSREVSGRKWSLKYLTVHEDMKEKPG